MSIIPEFRVADMWSCDADRKPVCLCERDFVRETTARCRSHVSRHCCADLKSVVKSANLQGNRGVFMWKIIRPGIAI